MGGFKSQGQKPKIGNFIGTKNIINPHMLAIDFPIEGYNSVLYPQKCIPHFRSAKLKTNG